MLSYTLETIALDSIRMTCLILAVPHTLYADVALTVSNRSVPNLCLGHVIHGRPFLHLYFLIFSLLFPKFFFQEWFPMFF